MKYLSQSMLKVMTLASLFAAAQTSTPGRNASQVAGYIKNPVGERRVSLSIEELLNDGLVEDIGETDWVYALTATGYAYAEDLYLSENQNNFKIAVDGLVAHFEGGNDPAKLIETDDDQVQIPAADRFVHIGHNSAGYEDALEASKNAVEAIRQSNEIDPEERSWIVPNLQVGIEALKRGGNLLVSGLKTFLIEPLKAALKASSEERIKSLISIAISALKNLIGS